MWRDDDNENYFNRKTRKRQMLYLNYCTFHSVKNAYVCFDILLLMCAMFKLLLLLYLSKTFVVCWKICKKPCRLLKNMSKTLSFVEKYAKNIMIYVRARDYPFKRAKRLTKKKQNMSFFFPLLKYNLRNKEIWERLTEESVRYWSPRNAVLETLTNIWF